MKASQREKSETEVIQFKQWNRNKFTGDAYANNRNQFSTQGKFHIKASTKYLWFAFAEAQETHEYENLGHQKTKQKVMLFSKDTED